MATLDIQLGRRNLSPIQRIAVTEKYRPIYEKKAKENQGTRNDLKNNIPQNIGECEKKKRAKDREVNSKLAKVANVSPETYRQAKRVLDSNNEDIKKRVLSGGDRCSKEYIRNQGVEKLPQVDSSKKERNPTTSEKLADIAGVKPTLYKMCAKILNSNNEDIKQRILSGGDRC